MALANRLATGSGWASLGKVSSLVLGLGTNVILARIIAPAEFGAYFLVISIAAVAVIVGQLGMNQAVVRFIAGNIASQQPAKAKATILKAFGVVLVGSTLVGLLYAGLDRLIADIVFKTPVIATVGGLVFVWIIASALRGVAAECFRGLHDIKMASLFELFAYALIFFIFIAVAWSVGEGLGLYNVVLFSTIAAIISAVWAVWMLGRKTLPMPSGNSVPSLELLTVGWPLLVSNLVIVVMTQAGLWIVGIVATSSDVALYGAAYRLVVLLQLPLLIFNSVVPQLIAELHVQGKKEEIERFLRMAASIVFIPTIILYCFILVWGEGLLLLLFGPFYTGSYWLLILLGAGVTVNAWAGFCGPALMMTGNQLSLMRISLVCGLFTLLSAFYLGQLFGKEGVAAAMAFGLGLQHLLMVVAVKAHLGIWTFAGRLSGLTRRLIHLVN